MVPYTSNENNRFHRPLPSSVTMTTRTTTSSSSSVAAASSRLRYLALTIVVLFGTLPSFVYGEIATATTSASASASATASASTFPSASPFPSLSATGSSTGSPSPSSTASTVVSSSPTPSPIAAPLFYENNIIVSGAMGYTNSGLNQGTVDHYLYEIQYHPSIKSFSFVRSFPLPNSTVTGKANYSSVLLGDDCDNYGGQLNLNLDGQFLVSHGLNIAPRLGTDQVKDTTERVYSLIDYTGNLQQYPFDKFVTSGSCIATSFITSVVPLVNGTGGIYYSGGYPATTSVDTDGIFYYNSLTNKTIFPIANNPYAPTVGDRYRYMIVYNNQLYASKSNGIYTIGTGLPTTLQVNSSIVQYAVYTNTVPATPGVTTAPDARGFAIHNLTYAFVADGSNGLIRATYNSVSSIQNESPQFDYVATAPKITETTFDKEGRAVTTMMMEDHRPYAVYTTKTAIYLYDIDRLTWVTNSSSGLAVSFTAADIPTGLSGRVLTFRGISKAPRSIRYSQLFPTPSASATSSPSVSASHSAPASVSSTANASTVSHNETSPSASPSSIANEGGNTNSTGNSTSEASPSTNATNVDNNSTNTDVSPTPSIRTSNTPTPSVTSSRTPDPSPILKLIPVRIVQVSMIITLPSGNATNTTVYDAAAKAGANAIANYLKVNVTSIIIIGLEPVYKRISGNSRLLQVNPSTTPSASPTPSVTPSPGWENEYILLGYSIKYGIDLSAAVNSTTLIQYLNSTNSSTTPDDNLLVSAITSLFTGGGANLTTNNTNTNNSNGPSTFFSFLLTDDSFAQALGYANASDAAPSLSNVVSSVPSATVTTYEKPTMVVELPVPLPPAPAVTDDNSIAIIAGAAGGGGGAVLIILIAVLVWYCKCRTVQPAQGKLLSSNGPTPIDPNFSAVVMNPLATKSPAVPYGPNRRHATMQNTFATAGLTVRSTTVPSVPVSVGTVGDTVPLSLVHSDPNVTPNGDQLITIAPLAHLGRTNHSRMKTVLDVHNPYNGMRMLENNYGSSSEPSMGDVSLSMNPLNSGNGTKERYVAEPEGTQKTKKNKKKAKKQEYDSDDSD